MISCPPIPLLATAVWEDRAARHRARAERHTLAARQRRDRGQPHPVEDFLFQYYPYPLSLLDRWQPGIGVALEWTETAESPALPPDFSERQYSRADGSIFADPGRLSDKERDRLKWIAGLLAATRDRAPNFACHGLHE